MRDMKKLLRISALLLGVCIIFPLLFTGVSAETSAFLSTPENVVNDELIVQFSNESNDQYDKLTAYWGDEFPSYYGGAYISNQEFYILVTCDPSSVQDEIWKVTGNNKIIIKQVLYSYEYLVSVKDEIVSRIAKLSEEGNEKAKHLIGFGVDEIRNNVFVEYLDDVTVAIDMADIYDMTGYRDLVSIVHKKEPYTPKTDINAGSKDWVVDSTLGLQSTISCCGSCINALGQTELGFLIAGHEGNLYDNITIGSTSVGTVASRSYGGQLDASFVNLDIQSSYLRTKKLSTNYTIDGYSNVGVVGTSYTMHGMTSGIISGTVNNTSFTFVMGGVTFSNFIRMEMTVSSGDSGGPLVKQNTGYSRNIIGTLSGGDSTYANFTKFSVIRTTFNFTLY